MSEQVTQRPTADLIMGEPRPQLLRLDEPLARTLDLTGAKAANLAASLVAGLPVIPGFVITTQGTSLLGGADEIRDLAPNDPLRKAWLALSGDGSIPLAVRSSSVVEDSTTSSMAGQFVSVLHVTGWDAFADAVAEVIASSANTELGDAPMAVLVQPMAEARLGGVLFGLDPLTGNRRRYLASLTEGLPEQIVSGAVTGTTIVLSRHGRIRSVTGPLPARLGVHDRRRLAKLAQRTRRVFGAPQDMEWLIEPGGTLRLLQSRPITASAVPVPHSHPLGPGPVAETFPDALRPLERDLWEPPLEDGLREALRLSGAVSNRALHERFVVDVGGRVAVDLEALGVVTPKRTFWRMLDPRPPYRHLKAAWRIGRLRVAFPAIAGDLAAEVDVLLGDMPSVCELGDQQLLTVIDNTRRTLMGLHAHEVLAGFFLDQRATATTAASVALATVTRARLDGVPDERIPSEYPVVLALLPPRVGASRPLPTTSPTVRMPSGEGDDPMALAREAMRLRVRWVQELSARAALEIGRRLTERGQIHYPEDIRELRLTRLRELVDSFDIGAAVMSNDEEGPPLPAVFRFAADGSIVADTSPAENGVQGVSAGRGQGRITHDATHASGTVLVVPALDPSLASVLPDLAGLVSETGSPLSHLAILAREYRVPVIVGYRDPLDDDAVVLVDGGAGTVEVQP